MRRARTAVSAAGLGGEPSRLAYELRAALAPGPGVLLLHGLGGSRADWALQVPVLAPRFPVVLVDLPGHGASPRLPGRTSIERMAAAVRAVLDDLDLGRVHVVGLSLGGAVGLALALEAPARVRSLTLVNAVARLAPPGPAGALRWLARAALLAGAPMERVAAHVARGLFPRPDQQDLRRQAIARLAATPRAAYVAALRALAAFDARARLAAVTCPTLVVAGREDRTLSLAAKARLVAGLPRARFVILPGSGHATPLDCPARFNAALLDFLTAH